MRTSAQTMRLARLCCTILTHGMRTTSLSWVYGGATLPNSAESTCQRTSSSSLRANPSTSLKIGTVSIA